LWTVLWSFFLIILSVIVELPLSVRGLWRRTQPIRKLLNDLLIPSALNPTCLLQCALNPTCLLQVCKFCELFCGHSSSLQECVTVGINLGTVWLLFYYRTSKLINVLLFSALNPTCLLQCALNPTCLLQVNDFPTHLYLRSGSLYLGKLARKWCELGKDGKSNASNDIQQHVNSANCGDVDIRNLTVTLIRTVVLQRSWYQMPGCSVQCKMNKNIHGYMAVW
jgi:hypothetical protein